jgi:hypothetical protein
MFLAFHPFGCGHRRPRPFIDNLLPYFLEAVMFTQAQLQELLSFEAGEATVLSLYLNADVGQETREAIKLRVRGLLREAGATDTADATAIERYFDHTHDWSKPGLALFSCVERDFWRVYPTAVPFRNRIRATAKPYVKPLAHLLDFYAHYGVVLVDKLGGRFFEYHLGELQADGGMMGEDVRKLKSGGGSTSIGTRGGGDGIRQEKEAIVRNMRETGQEVAEFFTNRPIRRLFIGGTAENVAHLREHLPKQLLACLAGTFASDMDAPEHEVRQRTLALLHEANGVREAKLVEDMVNTAAQNGHAVTGLDKTLYAVFESRIQTLIISDGYRTQGYEYPTGYLSASLVIDKPEAAGTPHELADVVEAAVSRTMATGGHVEVIADNPELEKHGRIGAILRY